MPVSAEPETREHGTNGSQATDEAPARMGPLLALCGLVGGAGTTTLAYLVALAAAGRSGEPVLVADTGGPSGGLAGLAGVETPRSLPALAAALSGDGSPGGGLYAIRPGGVRVIAARPDFGLTCPSEQLERLLSDAREAHGLTVIDCGTLASEADRSALGAATHVAWVLPATPHGVSAGARVLDAAPRPLGEELLVARREIRQSKAQLCELRRIAAERAAPLVLVPDLPALEAGNVDHALEQAQIPIQAILGAVRR